MTGLLSPCARAQTVPDPAPVVLVPGPDPIPLDGHIAELYDPAGELTFDDVRTPEVAARFTVGARAIFTHGLSSDTYWYRMTLRNPQARPSDTGKSTWVLTLGVPTLDYLDIHVERAGGGVETFLAGDLRHSDPRLLPAAAFAIPLTVAAGEQVTVHVRMQTTGRHQFWPILWSDSGFRARADIEAVARGFFNGVFVVMALYNLLLYARLRERTYLYFVLFLLAFQGAGLVLNGAAWRFGQDLFDGALAFINGMAAWWTALSPALLLLFSTAFMQTGIHLPRTHGLLKVLTTLAFLVPLVYPLAGFLLTVQLQIVIFGSTLLLLAGIASYLSLKGVRVARYYLLAFSALLVVMLFFMAETVGWFPTGWVVVWMPGIAVSTAVALLSLALADRLHGEQRERERLTRLRNFFAPQVAEAILDEGGKDLLAPRRREVTVLFTDLRGFTALAAQSEPEDVIRVLREYHEAVVDAAARHGGNVEHIAGDGVMVYFNAPVEVSEPEARATRMAFELRDQFELLRAAWRRRGHEVGVGIGLACGYATVGAVGAKGRMDYSCIGTVTNVAARLCALASHGQVLATETLLNRVESIAAAESAGRQELKGIPKPVNVYNLRQAELAVPAS